MEVLWTLGEASVANVHKALKTDGKRPAYSTVLTIMVRLHAKGMLTRTRIGKMDLYQPGISAEDFKQHSARLLAGNLIRGYDQLAIASFVEELAKVSPERLQELRELVDRTSARDDSP